MSDDTRVSRTDSVGAQASNWLVPSNAGGIVIVLFGLLLPVQRAADWFDGAYSASERDLVLGVWILKVSLIGLGAAAVVIGRRVSAARVPHNYTIDSLRWRAIAPIVVIVTLALILRLNHLDTDLWIDEVLLRSRYVPLDVRQLVSTYDSQNHQPLYSILARVSFLVAGGSDWTIRLPAVLFGVGSLVALFSFGRRITSSAEATLAALLLAVSYHHVWFSQNARGYTAMMFLAILGTGLFLDLWHGRGRYDRVAWAYALVMALATYTHLTGALIAAGHALAMVLCTRWNSAEGRTRVRWPVVALILSAVIGVTLYAPMLPQVWRVVTTPTMSGVEVEWTQPGWMLREGLRVLSDGIPGGLWAVGAAVALLGIGVVSYWRQSRITTLVMFLPPVITFAAVVAVRHNLWPRFFFFAGGFLALAALRGGFVVTKIFVRWHADRVAVVGAGVIALLSLVTVPRAWQPKQQFRSAWTFVEEHRTRADAVVALDVAASVYVLRGWAPDWQSATTVAALTDIEGSAPRTWIVYTLPARVRAMSTELYDYVTSRYRVVRVFPASVGGGEIHVLRHDSTSSHD